MGQGKGKDLCIWLSELISESLIRLRSHLTYIFSKIKSFYLFSHIIPLIVTCSCFTFYFHPMCIVFILHFGEFLFAFPFIKYWKINFFNAHGNLITLISHEHASQNFLIWVILFLSTFLPFVSIIHVSNRFSTF